MAENNTLLEKLDGLVSRFEEVSTLITDPNVIADQKRYVKLTKEYKELNEIIKARKEYMQCLNGLEIDYDEFVRTYTFVMNSTLNSYMFNDADRKSVV